MGVLAFRRARWAYVCTIVWSACLFKPSAGYGQIEGGYDFRATLKNVSQKNGGWKLFYRLEYLGPVTLQLAPEALSLQIKSWVSNSRLPGHGVPRKSEPTVTAKQGTAGSPVIDTADHETKCHERIHFAYWVEKPGEFLTPAPGSPERNPTFFLTPGTVLNAEIDFEHSHEIYGEFDPLLGDREISFLYDGTEVAKNVVEEMGREQRAPVARTAFASPPPDRMDDRFAYSGKESLHLEAHVPGNFNFRFPELIVRWATKMKLTFWYLIANGTDGTGYARIAQYHDVPESWKILRDGAWDQPLPTVGRWTKVEHYFETERTGNKLALDFRIDSTENIGEMWVDDISLITVGQEIGENP